MTARAQRNAATHVPPALPHFWRCLRTLGGGDAHLCYRVHAYSLAPPCYHCMARASVVFPRLLSHTVCPRFLNLLLKLTHTLLSPSLSRTLHRSIHLSHAPPPLPLSPLPPPPCSPPPPPFAPRLTLSPHILPLHILASSGPGPRNAARTPSPHLSPSLASRSLTSVQLLPPGPWP